MKIGFLAKIIIGNLLILSLAGIIASVVWSNETKKEQKEAIKLGISSKPTPTILPKQLVVHMLSGPVFVQPATASTEAVITKDTPITEGTIVRTGSTGRAEIRYPNNSVTRLNYNSKIKVNSFEATPQQSSLQLLEGSIWNRVMKLLGKEEFQTETEGMVATVRGTAYEMSILPDGTNNVEVEEGVVDVLPQKAQKTQKAIPITAATRIRYQPESSSQPVVEGIPPQTVKTEWKIFNTEMDKKLENEAPTPTIQTGNDNRKRSDTDKNKDTSKGEENGRVKGVVDSTVGSLKKDEKDKRKEEKKEEKQADKQERKGEIIITLPPVPVLNEPTSIPPTTQPELQPTTVPPDEGDKQKKEKKEKDKNDNAGVSVEVSIGGVDAGVELNIGGGKKK